MEFGIYYEGSLQPEWFERIEAENIREAIEKFTATYENRWLRAVNIALGTEISRADFDRMIAYDRKYEERDKERSMQALMEMVSKEPETNSR